MKQEAQNLIDKYMLLGLDLETSKKCALITIDALIFDARDYEFLENFYKEIKLIIIHLI
jgi:hypothetical protein